MFGAASFQSRTVVDASQVGHDRLSMAARCGSVGDGEAAVGLGEGQAAALDAGADGGGELGVVGPQGREGGGGAEADEQSAGGVGELRLGVSESRTWGVMIEAMGSDGVSKASRSQAVR